jgi:outer membrane protein
MTLAYQNNPSLEAQRASLRALGEQVSQALSNWRPSIDATASAGRTYQYTPELAPFEIASS